MVYILWREGGVRGQKTSLAYIKVQPVIELLLFTELQNRLCRKYGASSLGLLLSPIHDIGGEIDPKWPFLIILAPYILYRNEQHPRSLTGHIFVINEDFAIL